MSFDSSARCEGGGKKQVNRSGREWCGGGEWNQQNQQFHCQQTSAILFPRDLRLIPLILKGRLVRDGYVALLLQYFTH